MYTILLALLPVLVLPWITKAIWPRTITWIEVGSALAAGTLITLVVYACGMVSF